MPSLYFYPGACSLAPHIVLRELGFNVDLIPVDLRQKKLADGSDYLAVNPKGQVPALKLDDGTLMTEGAVIMQYLADRDPQRRLLPAIGNQQRYFVLEWLNFVSTELHKNFSLLFRPDTTADYRPVALAAVETKFAFVDAHFGGGDYLGDDFSIADAYLYVIATWLPRVDIDTARWPALAAFVARVAARPAVVAAVRAEKTA